MRDTYVTGAGSRVHSRRGGIALVIASGLAIVASGCAWIAEATVDLPYVPTGDTGSVHALSADGRYMVFSSSEGPSQPTNIYRRDLLSGTTTKVSVDLAGQDANGSSMAASISGDGRYVVFSSDASDLVANDQNSLRDVFRRDMDQAVTVRVSIDAQGGDADGSSDLYRATYNKPAVVSDDGRYIAFASEATDLTTVPGDVETDIFVRDMQGGTTSLVSATQSGGEAHANEASMSADGAKIAFSSPSDSIVAGDGNGAADVFVRDTTSGVTSRASVDVGGNDADSGSGSAVISADGNVVAFVSSAGDLVAGDLDQNADIFVRDLATATTTLASVDASGGEPDSTADPPLSLSADGRFLMFWSRATDLVASDGNGAVGDIFVRDLMAQRTVLVSADRAGRAAATEAPRSGVLSRDGRYVGFESDDQIAGNTTPGSDGFVRFVATPTVDAISVNTVNAGASALVTVTGSWFMPDAAVISPTGGDGLSVGATTFISDTELQATITVSPDALTRKTHLAVVNPGSGPGASTGALGLCAGCVSIIPPPASFTQLGDLVVDIDGVPTLLGESGLHYLRGTRSYFDDPDTPEFDGIARHTREFLDCSRTDPPRPGLPADVWSIGQQVFTSDLITMGIHTSDAALVADGVKGLDWGVNLAVNSEAVLELDRDCDETGPVPDYGGTHHTTQWLEAVGRSVHLLLQSDYAEDYQDSIAAAINQMEQIVGLLVQPDNWQYWKQHWLVSSQGDMYTHRAYMMAAALELAASLTDDPVAATQWSDRAVTIAQRGMDEQWENGVNPELGGYDISYQMYGAWLAEVYHSLLDPTSVNVDAVGEKIDHAIDWMSGWIDPVTGEVPLGDSTRTCQGETQKYDPADLIRVFLLWGSTRPGRESLIDQAILVDSGQPIAACEDLLNGAPVPSISSSDPSVDEIDGDELFWDS